MPETNTLEVENEELLLLKEQADIMGLEYHPSIGVTKLRERLLTAMAEAKAIKEAADTAVQPNPIKETTQEVANRKRQEALKLVRVVVNCMNPNKQLWEGEIFTISNRVIGTAKKFVPFNQEAGYHIPHVIYEYLLDRQCQVFYTVTDPKTGSKTRRGKLIKEFNVVVLPSLTQKELHELAALQAATRSID